MKKLFTLIAAALFAVSASAKEAIDVSSLYSEGTTINFDGTWAWKGINMSTGSLVEDKEAKTADDSGVTYYDASAFDYIVVKYSASTADVNLIAQYNCKGTIGQYGAEYNQGQITIDKSATGGIIGLALDATYKKTINAIALQNGNATGTLTIEEVYFATEAEWEAVKPAPPTTKEIDFTTFGGYVAANKNFVFKAGEAGWYSKWIGTLDPDYFKYLVVEVASSTGDVQLVIQGTKSEGATPAENLMITKTEGAQTFYADIEGYSNISQMAFQNFNFSDPENEDWNAKAASAMETTMVITAMYLSKDAPSADGGEESTSMAIIYSEMKAGDFTVANATKNTDESTDTKNVYDIAANEELQFTLNAAPNVVFTITNGSDKAKAFIVNVNGDDTTDKGSVEFGGKNGVVIFKDAKVGDVIKMSVAAKGSTAGTIGVLPSTGNDLIESTVITLPKKAKNTEGADADGYVWKEFSFTVTEDMIKTLEGVKVVRVKETTGGYRCKAASINADLPTGIQNVKAADVKSANDAIYNLAGQKVNESYKGIVIKNGKKYFQK